MILQKKSLDSNKLWLQFAVTVIIAVIVGLFLDKVIRNSKWFEPYLIHDQEVINIAPSPLILPEYKVVSVVDGDTLKIKDAQKVESVRLLGVDALEIGSSNKADDCWAIKAKEKVKTVTDGVNVVLVRDPSQGDKDKYGRLLRYITVGGDDLGRILMEEGLVRYYPYFETEKSKQYKELENQAKQAKIGMWGEVCKN